MGDSGALLLGFTLAAVSVQGLLKTAALATLVLPLQLQNAAIFIIFLMLLFFRPQGFFGRSTERA